MERRDFLRATAGLTVAPVQQSRVAQGDATFLAPTAGDADRTFWIGIARRLSDPILTNLANGRLKLRMPVEEASGANRRGVTHLEAFGRLIAGIAPWLDLPSDDSAEGRLRAQYGALARGALASAVDPVSPDFLNFTRDRQPLVDAAFLAHGLI
ncbi:MAG: DUF2264 domain-containing protein, partial [Vicinamibacterales bacterium]